MASSQTMEWVASAERDRDSVYILLESSKPPYEIIAFHCQQCAEKYLKALFVQHDRKPLFVHDLLRLNRGMQDLYPALADIEAECERLTPFGTVTRYPVADGENGVEIVVIDVPGYFPLAFGTNYPEFPDSCRGVEFILRVDVLQVLVDCSNISIVELSDQRLTEPDTLLFESTFDSSSAVSRLVEDDFAFA